MSPKYTLDKIKFSTDPKTFLKAVDLYEKGKVTQFKNGVNAYSAIVVGTKPYRVSVEARNFTLGSCECYLGQTDVLCKHLVALAISAVMGGKKMKEEDKKIIEGPVCSGKPGKLAKAELSETKNAITSAMRYIKSYGGSSRTWFAYQNSLDEGCARLSKIVSDLPVSEQTATLLVDTLLRLDERLCYGGVDDSDGIVGGFIQDAVIVLKEYVKLDSACLSAFEILKTKKTCFGWEETLF